MTASLAAHPISLTSVFVNAHEDKITAELNMLVEDLVLYYWMETDAEFHFPADAIKEQALEHQAFLLRHFHLRDRDGNRFEGEIVEMDFSELGESGVHIDEVMARAIRYHFEFPFEDRPEFLTVSQDFGGEDPPIPAEMGVRFFHHGVHMETVMLSHRSAHTIHLDWDAGWEHAREDIDAARERLRQRQEETLGITSYSTVYSYVYITDTEIRHEILIPLLTLETWLPLPRRRDSGTMSVEEQRAVRDDVFGFLARHNRIEIDGVLVQPILDRMVFFGPDIRDFARQAPEREVSVYNSRVGVILSFPARDGPPGRMSFEWDFFNERMPVLRPTIYAFEEGRRRPSLHRRETRFDWKNDKERTPIELTFLAPPEPVPVLRLPLLSVFGGAAAVLLGVAGAWPGQRRRRLACALVAGGLAVAAVAARPYLQAAVPHPFHSQAAVGEEEARAIFETLHGNLYRAFAFRDEERIYDALNESVAGKLLEEVYLQMRRQLTIEEQGGAVSRVSGIELLEGRREDRPGALRNQSFSYRCAWTVTGTVEHWGHIHTRTNQYEAIFTIEALPSGWRITAFEPLQEERLERQIRVRE